MEVYAEYLFVENFIMGVLILYLSGKIGNLKTNRWRLVTGGTLCGLFSFIIFVQNIGMLSGIIIKIMFSMGLAYVVFKKTWIKGTVIVYIVSAFMGGMTIILLYITKIRGITNNAVLYINDITYTNVAFGAVVSCIVIIVFCKIITEKQLRERIFTEITLKIDDYYVKHRALIDSGNFLKEPLSGRPVAIISKSAAEELKNIKTIDFDKRYCLIPYSSIGIKSGLLEGYKVDNAYINGKTLGSIVIAVYDTEFCKRGEEGEYQMLLSKDFLSGGVA